MKTILSLLTVFLLSVGLATAQSSSTVGAAASPSNNGADITGFRAPINPDSTSKSIKAPPNPHPDLKPRAGGIFVDGAKHGWVMISPAAPASYGMGEKYLSAPSTRADLQHESAYAAHRDTGGFKLFSWEF